MSAVRELLATTTYGSGPAVLWIHGYTMDSSTWQPLWQLLPGHRHIGVDLPGHGRSGPVPTGLTLPGLAAALAELARDEQASRMVALSFGSLVATQLAVDEPALLDRLVLAAPTLGGAPAEPHAKRRYQELTMLRRLAGASAPLADLWMTSPPDIFRGTEKHPELRARLRSVIARHSWAELDNGAMQTLTAQSHTPSDLARIKARTLVFVGDEDMPVFTANARLLRDTVPDCRLRTVTGTGHLPLLERPEAVAADLAAQLA
ncbi:alpha/beta hydrolase [Streptomyces sp. NPDC051322]|uniref:alpha/beta fold hydrolase n=1 Tax=Streptomyces sp. NPDC051322 TaxID=3154645 RepID=UPI00344BBFEE